MRIMINDLPIVVIPPDTGAGLRANDKHQFDQACYDAGLSPSLF